MKKRANMYSVYGVFPDGYRVEILMFATKAAALKYANTCAAQNAGMSFDVCEVKLLTTFRTEAK